MAIKTEHPVSLGKSGWGQCWFLGMIGIKKKKMKSKSLIHNIGINISFGHFSFSSFKKFCVSE